MRSDPQESVTTAGCVQATVTADAASLPPASALLEALTPDSSLPAALTAHVAWVMGEDQQGHGYAAEAAAAMVSWLAEHGVGTITASIHPENRASTRVAERVGLRPTGVLDEDGEEGWTTAG